MEYSFKMQPQLMTLFVNIAAYTSEARIQIRSTAALGDPVILSHTE